MPHSTELMTAQLVSTDPTDDWTVILAQDVHLGPQQTRVAKVRLSRGGSVSHSTEVRRGGYSN